MPRTPVLPGEYPSTPGKRQLPGTPKTRPVRPAKPNPPPSSPPREKPIPGGLPTIKYIRERDRVTGHKTGPWIRDWNGPLPGPGRPPRPGLPGPDLPKRLPKRPMPDLPTRKLPQLPGKEVMPPFGGPRRKRGPMKQV